MDHEKRFVRQDEYITYPLILPKFHDKTLKDNKFTYEINETFSQ